MVRVKVRFRSGSNCNISLFIVVPWSQTSLPANMQTLVLYSILDTKKCILYV